MNTIIPLGLFLIIQMVIQHYERKAQGLLSNDEKAKLLDVSSQFYFIRMAPTVILLLVYGGFMYLKPSISVMSIGLVVYVLFIASSSLISQRMIVRKLSMIGLPTDYVNHRGRSAIIQSVCLIAFLSWILGSTLWKF
jgi:hypothetical protein